MADERVDLPDGGWAMLRDPQRVTERQRRPVSRLQSRLAGSALGAVFKLKGKVSDEEFDEECRKVLNTDDYELLDDLNDALIAALVESWSYDGPPSAEAAQDRPSKVYDALKAACAKYVNELSPSFEPTKEGLADPASPTVSSTV